MKIREFVAEDQVNEILGTMAALGAGTAAAGALGARSPQTSMLGRGFNRVAAALGSQTAAGRVQATQQATNLSNQLKQWMGMTGVQALNPGDVVRGKVQPPILYNKQGLAAIAALLKSQPQWKNTPVSSKNVAEFALGIVQQLNLGVATATAAGGRSDPATAALLAGFKKLSPRAKQSFLRTINQGTP